MAIARLCIKVGKAGKAAPHAAYIARQGKYANRLNTGERLVATESGNMPRWARHNPLFFWKAADEHERKNGSTYREMEIALPRDISESEQIALVRNWVRQEIGDVHAFQWAIHTPKAVDGGDQPHLHLMFSERQCDVFERDPDQYFKRFNAKDPERGGSRKGYGARSGQTLTKVERTAELKELRGRWEVMCNDYLEQAGLDERIDMRSHAERGTGLEPEGKMLPSEWRGEGKSNVIDIRNARAELANARQELAKLIPDLGAEIISLADARQRREVAMFDLMPASELAAEIKRLQPVPEKELVSLSPGVVDAKKQVGQLRGQYRKAGLDETLASAAAVRWRNEHPVKAGLHDMRISHSLDLRRLAKRGEKARQEQQTLALRIEDAKRKCEAAEMFALNLVRAEQAPIIAKLREMNKILKGKLLQEREAELYRRKAVQTFVWLTEQRRLRGSDSNRSWQALPEALRDLIAEYNRQSVDMQQLILSRILEDQDLSQIISNVVSQRDLDKDDNNLSR